MFPCLQPSPPVLIENQLLEGHFTDVQSRVEGAVLPQRRSFGRRHIDGAMRRGFLDGAAEGIHARVLAHFAEAGVVQDILKHAYHQ